MKGNVDSNLRTITIQQPRLEGKQFLQYYYIRIRYSEGNRTAYDANPAVLTHAQKQLQRVNFR